MGEDMRLKKRVEKLEKEVFQLQCKHPEFEYFTKTGASYNYIKRCKTCDKSFLINKEDYYAERMLKAKKEFEDIKQEVERVLKDD